MSTQAHGARWRALADLLPNSRATVNERRQVINLAVFGFQADPIDRRPVQRVRRPGRVSQPVIDSARAQRLPAAALNEKAETRGIKSARDLVVLVAVNLYLEAVTAASRIDVARAQLEPRRRSSAGARISKTSGLVASVDVLRAQVQVQTQRQR